MAFLLDDLFPYILYIIYRIYNSKQIIYRVFKLRIQSCFNLSIESSFKKTGQNIVFLMKIIQLILLPDEIFNEEIHFIERRNISEGGVMDVSFSGES